MPEDELQYKSRHLRGGRREATDYLHRFELEQCLRRRDELVKKKRRYEVQPDVLEHADARAVYIANEIARVRNDDHLLDLLRSDPTP